MEIVKDIPIPEKQGKRTKYDIPLSEMKVGDHVKIAVQRVAIKAEAKLIRNQILRYKYKNPKTDFTVRALEGGVGIWRIK